MTPQERALILVTSRMLRAAGSLRWLATGLTLLSALAMILGRSVALSITAILLGVIALFFGARVSFDAHLLEDIATGRMKTEDLDIALGKFSKGPRPWPDRCRGAKRLVVFSAVATIAQLITVAMIR